MSFQAGRVRKGAGGKQRTFRRRERQYPQDGYSPARSRRSQRRKKNEPFVTLTLLMDKSNGEISKIYEDNQINLRIRAHCGGGGR
jgi:hypothetical protein